MKLNLFKSIIYYFNQFFILFIYYTNILDYIMLLITKSLFN